MKLKEFYEKLAELKDRGWYFKQLGVNVKLLRDKQGCCPLSAVCNSLYGTNFKTSIVKSSKKIGLEREKAENIALSADDVGYKKTRKKLLKAVGLYE